MTSKIEKDLQDFEKALSFLKDHPGYVSFRKDFIEMRTNHPEWEKPADLPIAKTFNCIGWNDLGLIRILVKHASKMKVDLWDRYNKSFKEGRATEWEFVKSIIDELAQYRVIANALHAKLDLIQNSN